MATGTENKATAKAPRAELGIAKQFLAQKDPELARFENVGDRVSGTIVGAEMAETVFAGERRKNAAGRDKSHLRMFLTGDDGETKWVLDIRSGNQKDALSRACLDAGIGAPAIGDHFSMEYTHDDEVLRDGLNAARNFTCTVTPAG
jgi:hypothetical protein